MNALPLISDRRKRLTFLLFLFDSKLEVLISAIRQEPEKRGTLLEMCLYTHTHVCVKHILQVNNRNVYCMIAFKWLSWIGKSIWYWKITSCQGLGEEMGVTLNEHRISFRVIKYSKMSEEWWLHNSMNTLKALSCTLNFMQYKLYLNKTYKNKLYKCK